MHRERSEGVSAAWPLTTGNEEADEAGEQPTVALRDVPKARARRARIGPVVSGLANLTFLNDSQRQPRAQRWCRGGKIERKLVLAA
eukprot:6203632-Pleurochrysis_carterae.AAC.3